MLKLPKVIIISGPTASGKTEFSLVVAKKINGEIISADSMQIYQGLDIGTAKATLKEMDDIKHHLIDVRLPNSEYSVADFQKQARSAITEIIERGKVPIIVGGTGLYIQSLVYDYHFEEFIQLDYTKYATLSLEELGNKLEKLDKQSYQVIEANNRRRITHALALAEQTNKSKTMREQEQKQVLLYDILPIALIPERESLYNKINKRVELMIYQGLIAEVDFFNRKFELAPQIKRAIGYRETLAFLQNEISTKAELIEEIQRNTRKFAKRQYTWIKNQRINYLRVAKESEQEDIIKKILQFVNQ